MNISGDYGTELLLRYTEERLARELEERRVLNERAAESRRQNGTRLSRFARFFFREEVAAGGPEWIRPTVHPVSGSAGVPAAEPLPVHAPAAAVPVENDNEERMPFRTLVGNRR